MAEDILDTIKEFLEALNVPRMWWHNVYIEKGRQLEQQIQQQAKLNIVVFWQLTLCQWLAMFFCCTTAMSLKKKKNEWLMEAVS